MSGLDSDGAGYPVCGDPVERPLRIRVLRYASLVLALAGVILLYLFSINREIPFVRIGDITPTMNFAYVRIAGEVTRDANIFNSGGLVFNVKDSNGEITVIGGRAQADALQADGKLPRHGDRVEVAGSLSVSAGQETKLRMQSSGQLVLNRKRAAANQPEVSLIRLADVASVQKGEQIAVAGILKSIDVPGPGSKAPYVLTLEEDGAQLAVIFWEDVFQSLDRKLPVPGKRISACGRVELHKDTVQLKVREASDLRVMEPRP